jgi:hypothetical protein
MSWNIKTPGDYINGPLTVAGSATITGALGAAGLNVTGATIPANGVYLGSANNLSFSTASTLGMTLDASGRLIRGGSTADTLTTDAATMVNIGNFAVQNAATTGTYIAIKPDVANQNVNINVDARSGGLPDLRFLFGSAEKFRMTATGNLNFQSGQGVNFGATTEAAGMTSETLNDYEEGTFTPVITSGMSGITYSDQNGRYVKIGRLVSFYIRLLTSAGTRDGGQTIFGGLPFNVGTGNGVAMIEYNNSGFQSGSSDATPRFYLPGGFGVIELYNSNGSAFVGNQLGSAGFDLRIFGHYFVA